MKRKGGWEKQKERKRVERVLPAYPTISTFFQRRQVLKKRVHHRIMLKILVLMR